MFQLAEVTERVNCQGGTELFAPGRTRLSQDAQSSGRIVPHSRPRDLSAIISEFYPLRTFPGYNNVYVPDSTGPCRAWASETKRRIGRR